MGSWRRIENHPGRLLRSKARPRHLGGSWCAAGIDDCDAVKIQKHLPCRRIGAYRGDVEAKRWQRAAIGEEHVADDSGALELRKIAIRYRRGCRVAGLQAPRLAGHVDIRAQQRVYETIEQTTRCKQASEIRDRGIVGGARSERIMSIDHHRTKFGRPTTGIEDRRQLLTRIAAAERSSGRRDLIQPARQRLRLSQCLGPQSQSRVEAASSGRRRTTANKRRGHLREILLHVPDRSQYLIDWCTRTVADQIAQCLVAFVDFVTGQQRCCGSDWLVRSKSSWKRGYRCALSGVTAAGTWTDGVGRTDKLN